MVPITTECTPGTTNVPTYSSAYVNGPTITADDDLPLVISYYPTAIDCTSATAPSTEYHFAADTCIIKNGMGTKYSYNKGQLTKTTYTDKKCTTGATSAVMTGHTCLSHAGEHSNSEQQFETITYKAALPTPSYLDYVYYSDPNCELEVSYQILDIVDYCLQDQDSSGSPTGTSFLNHYSPVKSKSDGSYQLKKINYNSTDCSSKGIVGARISR